ncbi:type IV secretory system conjugative DNA transfer family protein [Streptomyces sp. NBRC 110035]|uniref:type IV secretory system conjugative DNA transfer family protein n=1 Tax=Streptomyces sp. NBRC 110035 TaxID=1547867 RepID=UPI0005A64EA0|nr:hypothetical protein [Streptomyces sp. NBRC 110035]
MSQPTTAPARPAATERAIAYTTSLAPIAVGTLAPFLEGSAAFTAAIAYGTGAGFLAANYMNRLPDHLVDQLPAGDIIRAHRSPLFTSTLTTGMALGIGTLMGPDGADALMAGILNVPANPIPGIVSLGWWAAVALVPYKLRLVLARQRKPKPLTAAPPDTPTGAAAPRTPAEKIAYRWHQVISNRDTGTHKGQHLTVRTISAMRWQGTITAPTGASVTVTADTISSAYQLPADWITIRPGTHTGEAHITVNLQPPAELDPSTLTGAWTKWAARAGGVMAGTHLEEVRPDPVTGGEVARVVADDNTDALPTPDMRSLVGALRTSPLLLSYEPGTNPRKAVVRLMKENPLRAGVPFPGPHALLPSEGGYIRIGVAVSGRPVRLQLLDPKLGARHVIVTGVTGSGKGGVLQLIALASHLAGAVILYGDPKGSSNPAIEQMAAHSGLGEDGALCTLRIVRALVEHRINETARLKLKNFDPSVMRHVVVILDEASSLLGDKAQHRAEASSIIDLVARKGRSLGVSLVLANQILQLDQLGGKSSIRDNVVGSGGVVMLRSDSSQRNLIDLPPGMESVNPADIPATWSGEDDTLVYTDDVKLADPESTFGLGYFMTTDGVCSMGRSLTLEDATEHVDPDKVEVPDDWPDWDDRDAIAATSTLEGADSDDTGLDDDGSGGTASLLSGIDLGPKKGPTAEEKILDALQSFADPAGLETIYTSRETISRVSGVTGSTLDNTLGNLRRKDLIHRGADCGRERGTYALGRLPDDA